MPKITIKQVMGTVKVSTALVSAASYNKARQSIVAGWTGQGAPSLTRAQTRLLEHCVGLTAPAHSPVALKMMRIILAPLDLAGQDLVMDAYDFANREFNAIKRKSGGLYIDHLVETAHILVTICESNDSELIAAALVHDWLEDIADQSPAGQRAAKALLAEKFGQGVAELVDGETKLSKSIERDREQRTLLSLGKWLRALSLDPRIGLLKGGDRLSNMPTLSVFEAEKRRRIAKETREIYVPIMHAFGIWELRIELEKLALAELDPPGYKEALELYQVETHANRQLAAELAQSISAALERRGVIALQVSPRLRDISEVYRSMERDNKTLADYLAENPFYLHYVLIELRGEERNCFDAMSVIGSGREIDGFSFFGNQVINYLANPRPPGNYQALQCRVFRPELRGNFLLNIVTNELNSRNRLGFAALSREEQLRRKDEWLACLVSDAGRLGSLDDIRRLVDEVNSPIAIFNEEGARQELPLGATVLDYLIRREVELRYVNQVFVNERPAAFGQVLRDNDQIKFFLGDTILPADRRVIPAWLAEVRLVHSVDYIRRELARLDRGAQTVLGKEEIDKHLSGLFLKWENLISISWVDRLLRRIRQETSTRINDLTDLPVAVGQGLVSAENVAVAFDLLYSDVIRTRKGKERYLNLIADITDEAGKLAEITGLIRRLGISINVIGSYPADESGRLAKLDIVVPILSSLQRDQMVNILQRFQAGSNPVHQKMLSAREYSGLIAKIREQTI